MATFDAGSIEGKVDLDLNPFNLALDEALRRADDFDGKTFKANLGLDTGKFTTELDKMKAKLDQFKNDAATATAKVNVDRVEFDRLLITLRAFSKTTYTTRARVDVNGLTELAALRAALAGLPNRQDVDVNVNTRQASSSLGGMNTIILAIIALLPVLASALGAAFALAGALGVAVVALGVGFGALAIVAVPAMSQITEAMSATGKGINSLPPALRQAALAYRGLQDEIKTLQAAGGDRIGYALAAAFNTATTALKTLQPVILAAADAFTFALGMVNRFFGSADWTSFTAWLVSNLKPIVFDVTSILLMMVGTVTNLTQAFYNLGGSKILDSIATAFRDLNDWSSQLGSNPGFKLFMDTIIADLPPVMNFLGQLFVFIIHLMEALSPLGNVILNLASAFLYFINSLPPEVLGPVALGITAIVMALTGFGGPTAAVLVGIMALASGFFALVQSSPKLQSALQNIGAVLRDWFAPIWQKLTDLWNQNVVPAWDALVKKFSDPRMQGSLKELGDLFVSQVLPALTNLATVIVRDVIPSIINFISAAAPFVAFFVKLEAEGLIALVTMALNILTPALSAASDALNLIADLLNGNWGQAWKDAQKLVKDLADTILHVFGTSFDQVDKWSKDTNDSVNKWLGQIGKNVKDSWKDITDNVAASWADLSGNVNASSNDLATNVKASWTDLSTWFSDTNATLTKNSQASWSDFSGFFTDLFKTMKDNVEASWADFSGFFKGVFDNVLDYFKRFAAAHPVLAKNVEDSWHDLSTNVSASAADLTKNVKDSWTELSGWVTSTTNTMVTNSKASWSDLSSWFKSTTDTMVSNSKASWNDFSGFWKGIWDTISTNSKASWKDWTDFFKSTGDTASTNAKASWNDFSNFWKPLWNTISTNSKASWKDWSDFFSSTGNTLISNSKASWNDFSGFFIGLWKTVSTNVKASWNDLSAVAKTVWNNIISFIKASVNQAIGVINTLTKGLNVVLTFFLIPNIPQIPTLAAGGVLAGSEVQQLANGGRVGAGFKTQGPVAIVGEGNQHYPEYVIPTDPQYRSRAQSLHAEAGTKLMASGGLLPPGGVTGSAGATTAPGTSATSQTSWSIDPIGYINGLMNGAIGGMVKGPVGQMASSMIKKIIPAVIKKVQDAIAAAAAAAAAALGVGNNTGVPAGRAANVAAVQAVAATYGWGSGPEWNALVSVINRESGFNNVAQNPTSTAYGMFQFLNGTWGAYGATKTSDPHMQAVAGLRYIASRYHDPIGALAHENSYGWYDEGGILKPGMNLAINHTGKPERVLNADHTAKLDGMLNGMGSTDIADKLDTIARLLEENGAGATINVMGGGSDPVETARRTSLALKMR